MNNTVANTVAKIKAELAQFEAEHADARKRRAALNEYLDYAEYNEITVELSHLEDIIWCLRSDLASFQDDLRYSR